MSDNGSIDHINNFSDAEYNEWLDVQNEAAYWEAMHRQIDEVLILTGRISRRIDEASEILATIPTNKRLDAKYAEIECPF